ncbi:hypothetical protein EIQ30_19575 [Xanthomonas campestris]
MIRHAVLRNAHGDDLLAPATHPGPADSGSGQRGERWPPADRFPAHFLRNQACWRPASGFFCLARTRLFSVAACGMA